MHACRRAHKHPLFNHAQQSAFVRHMKPLFPTLQRTLAASHGVAPGWWQELCLSLSHPTAPPPPPSPLPPSLSAPAFLAELSLSFPQPLFLQHQIVRSLSLSHPALPGLPRATPRTESVSKPALASEGCTYQPAPSRVLSRISGGINKGVHHGSVICDANGCGHVQPKFMQVCRRTHGAVQFPCLQCMHRCQQTVACCVCVASAWHLMIRFLDAHSVVHFVISVHGTCGVSLPCLA